MLAHTNLAFKWRRMRKCVNLVVQKLDPRIQLLDTRLLTAHCSFKLLIFPFEFLTIVLKTLNLSLKLAYLLRPLHQRLLQLLPLSPIPLLFIVNLNQQLHFLFDMCQVSEVGLFQFVFQLLHQLLIVHLGDLNL